jgi:drug/metabolite transporter (DMT)-like permease
LTADPLYRRGVILVTASTIVWSSAGVLVIVGGAPDLGSLWAVAVSAVCGVSYAITIVLARARPDVPTTEATVLALLIVAAVTGPFAVMALPAGQMGLMALFGTFQMGLGLVLFTTGVRLIPAADAGLLSVLETVLGPLVVWLAFGEDPGVLTLIGGGIVVAAVVTVGVMERREWVVK